LPMLFEQLSSHGCHPPVFRTATISLSTARSRPVR
jgi:hypothetical protein